jgi:tetratricopeptide (TPR) repeat protein
MSRRLSSFFVPPYLVLTSLIVFCSAGQTAHGKDVLDSINTMGPSTLSTDDKPDPPASPLTQHLQAASAACKTAEAYAAYGNWQATIKVLEQVLAQDERNEVAHYEMAVVCCKTGDYKRASNEVSRAIQLNPHYANAYVQLGAIKAKLGDLSGSERAYLKAIELDPSLHQSPDGAVSRSLDAIRRLGTQAR